jgi:hypothetical protein
MHFGLLLQMRNFVVSRIILNLSVLSIGRFFIIFLVNWLDILLEILMSWITVVLYR